MVALVQQHHCAKNRMMVVAQRLLLGALFLIRYDVMAQSTTAWAVPYRSVASSEFVASAMMYDAVGDRIYVTGSVRRRAVEMVTTNYEDDATDDDNDDDDGTVSLKSNTSSSDCFLGILQVPRRVVSSNSSFSGFEDDEYWIRQFDRIGTESSQESCSGIQTFRQGNEQKVYLIGHSLLGPSLLQSQQNWYGAPSLSTNSSSNSTNHTVVYGLVLDVSWYNGRVNTGYLIASSSKLVEYPMAVAASGGDVYVASLQSQYGNMNPAYALHQMSLKEKNISLLDLTNDVAPEYGEHFSLHLQRLGQRSFTMNDLMTLPKPSNETTAPANFLGFKVPSFRQFTLAAINHTLNNKAANITNGNGNNRTATSSNTTASQDSNFWSNSTNLTSASNINDGMNTPENSTILSEPPSYDQYRYIVEPLVERWGREFYAQDDPTTTLSSVQVTSMLLVTRTRTTTLVNSANDDDDDTANADDAHPYDDDTVTVERQELVLIVAGNTRGSSLVIGGRSTDATANVFGTPDAALHGFVTSLDPKTGVMLRTLAVQAAASSHRPTVQILGLCHSSNKPDFVFAVGMTDGTLDSNASHQTIHTGVYQAFVQKIDVTTFSVIWTKQLTAAIFSSPTYFGSSPGSAYGMACAVTPDGMQVYLGGTLLDGAAVTLDGGVTNATTSFGKDDIFIAQFSTEAGTLNFVRQIGSRHDDGLAPGVSLVADKYGNAILLGNTKRSFLDPTAINYSYDGNQNNHVILLSVDRRNGDHVDLRDRVESTDSFAPSPIPVQEDELNSSSKIGVLYILIPTLLTVVSIFCCWWTFSRRYRNEQRIVARYLRPMDTGQKKRSKDPSLDIEQAKLCHNDDDLDTESSENDLLDETMQFCAPSHSMSSLNGDDGISPRYNDALLHKDEDAQHFLPKISSSSNISQNRRKRPLNNDTTNVHHGNMGRDHHSDPWVRWWEP
jgi:hypothetical protein